MKSRPAHQETPDRLYIITGGRSRVQDSTLDLVTLIVAESDPTPGMQSEHVQILRLCRRPTAVVEISAHLGLPVGVVKILLTDLIDMGRASARQPSKPPAGAQLPKAELLEKVLVGLRNL